MNCIKYSSLVTRADTLTIIQVQLPIIIWICRNTEMWETLCFTLPLDIHKVFHMYFYILCISQLLGCYTNLSESVLHSSSQGTLNDSLDSSLDFTDSTMFTSTQHTGKLEASSDFTFENTP